MVAATPPSILPYQDREEDASTGTVDSQRYLGHGTQCEEVSNRNEPAWRRVISHFYPLRLRARQQLRRKPNEACFCEKSMGRRRSSRRCLRLGLGLLIALYVPLIQAYTTRSARQAIFELQAPWGSQWGRSIATWTLWGCVFAGPKIRGRPSLIRLLISISGKVAYSNWSPY